MTPSAAVKTSAWRHNNVQSAWQVFVCGKRYTLRKGEPVVLHEQENSSDDLTSLGNWVHD